MNTVNTRLTRVYHHRFHRKYEILQEKTDQINVKKYTVMIANHPDPGNIGGCEYCPSGDSYKVEFNTGWAIIYQVTGSEIHFLNFYKPIPNARKSTPHE